MVRSCSIVKSGPGDPHGDCLLEAAPASKNEFEWGEGYENHSWI
jgi:hypothetical protein